MRPPRRNQANIEASAEQRRREDAATRLRDEVATLRTLRIRFDERRTDGQFPGMSYSKVIVVESAPATFEIRCTEPRCDGRHDLTSHVLLSLRRQLTTFKAESACRGIVGDLECNRVLAYTCEATYAPS
jgi:hypothetical protein